MHAQPSPARRTNSCRRRGSECALKSRGEKILWARVAA